MPSFIYYTFFVSFIFLSFNNQAIAVPNVKDSQKILTYIEQTWTTLTRDHQELYSESLDPKFPLKEGEKPIVYLPHNANLGKIQTSLIKQIGEEQFSKIQLIKLPKNANSKIKPGLLYLPYPYVVPGGRFNEMYGWDSYFIILGLIENHKIKLAQDIVNNFTYEINNYGKVLNANRSYYLDRSQPPLYTEMILAVYKQTHNKKWLAQTITAINRLYRYWTTPPHLVEGIGLSRYFALGNGPALEITHLKSGKENAYQKVIDYYSTHQIHDYDVSNYFDAKTKQLTPAFYKADRSVRESGLDVSDKFGPFGAAINDYIPVSLNSFLYKMELNTAQIQTILDHPEIAKQWLNRAKERKQAMNKFLWNSALGFYFDYNFKTKTSRPYISATSFYPLWANLASKQQAKRLVENLPALQTPCGILSSAYVTGEQWDAPFGWAPQQYFIVHGLLNYGYRDQAFAIARGFNQVIQKSFVEHGTIFEKYNLRQCTANLDHKVKFGYLKNQVGFGWTNGVYLNFKHLLRE